VTGGSYYFYLIIRFGFVQQFLLPKNLEIIDWIPFTKQYLPIRLMATSKNVIPAKADILNGYLILHLTLST
jgi:hypothetical protein